MEKVFSTDVPATTGPDVGMPLKMDILELDSLNIYGKTCKEDETACGGLSKYSARGRPEFHLMVTTSLQEWPKIDDHVLNLSLNCVQSC